MRESTGSRTVASFACWAMMCAALHLLQGGGAQAAEPSELQGVAIPVPTHVNPVPATPSTPAIESIDPGTNIFATLSDTNVIRSRDHISYYVEQDPVQAPEPMRLNVSDYGEVNFPVSRGFATAVRLRAEGRTVKEVREEVKTRLETEYYHQATVHLQLLTKDLASSLVYFFGAVRGTIPLPPGRPLTVTDAILQLGYPQTANLNRVTINRTDPDTGRMEAIRVNVQAVLDRKPEPDVELQDGDRVEVPERTFLLR